MAGRLVLVDGTGLIYRAYFALPSNLATKDGLHTNAILGFSTMFNKLLQRRSVEFGAVVFDPPGGSFRQAEYSEYKAQRDKAPDDLIEQLPWIDKVVQAYRFPILRVPGFEADDVIGTLAERARLAGHEVLIISSDKDFAQLIGEQVKMWETIRDVVFDRELVQKKWGVYPEKFVDYLALIGDKVDNIPGVPGIGAKGAQQLLEQYGSLQVMLEAEVSGKNGKLLKEFKDQALLSQRLATIQTNVPLPIELADLRLDAPDSLILNELHRSLEFYSLLKEGARSADAAAEEAAAGGVDYQDWDGSPLPSDRPVAVQFRWKGFAHQAELLGLAISWQEKQGRWVSPQQIPELDGWLRAPEIPKLVHDLRSQLVVLWRHGFDLNGAEDIKLMSYLCEPTKVMPHELGHVAREYLQRTLSNDEADRVVCQQADFIWQIYPILKRRLEELGLWDTYRQLDLPLAPVLARMQRDGIVVDPVDLDVLGKEFRGRLAEIEEKVYELAGHPFNLGSPKQLATVLFEELQLPVVKKTKTGYSTDAEVLEKLAPKHAIADQLLEHRKLAKLINTYTDVLSNALDPATGRIHASLQQTNSATGRLISTDPDLQRTPIRTPEGVRIRQTFLAPPGHKLISADWSQIELRVLAHMSQDPLLLDAFQNDHDIHRRTAAQLFHISEAEVIPAQREVAKTVNFATIYGQGATALAQIIRVPRKTAQEYIDQYFATYAGVRVWLDRTIEEGHRDGYVTTYLGRRRWIPELSSRNVMERQAGERIAANTPIQGTAADLCKMAMLNISRALAAEALNCRMLMQIHDELVFECVEEQVTRASELIGQHMQEVARLSVPLKVNLGVGRSWAEAH
ncbi:DNA polymerase I [bacterium]|nr:DNA polymerase I [bacterium]